MMRAAVLGLTARRAAAAAVSLTAMIVLSLAAAHALARTAEAHATLIRSNPENQAKLQRAPIRVTLNFSEGIERRLTKIEVRNSEGERVDDGEIAFDDDDPAFASIGLEPLDPGLYTVEYSNVSTVDGHPWSGLFEFIILNPDGSVPPDAEFSGAREEGTELLPEPVDAALKWIAMTALAVVAGAGLFVLIVYRPAARFLYDPPYRTVVEAGERWFVNVAHALLPISFIASTLLIIATVSRFETDTGLWDYLTGVRSGQYRGIQLLLIVATLAGADLLLLASSRRVREIGAAIAVAAAFGALFFYPMVSHAAAGAGRFWSVTSDYIHISAASLWLGMLVMLPPVLRARQAEGAQRYLFQANVFDRFSIAAGLSVVAVMASGIFNALVEFPEFSALYETTYGRVLIVKLAIMTPLLAVAGLNAYLLKPRLTRTIDAEYGDVEEGNAASAPSGNLAQTLSWLPRTIVLEIALIVAVFASVGVLTQTTNASSEIAAERAREQASAVYEQTFEQDGLRMALAIRPNLVGRNEYEVEVTDLNGQPVETITQVRLRFQYDAAAGTLPQSELILNEFDPGVHRGEGAFFSQPGNWRLELGIRRSDADDVNRTVIITVRPPVELETGQGGAFELPFTSFTWNEVAGALLILLGVLALIYRKPLRGLPGRAHTGVMASAVVAMIAGGVLAFGVDQHGEATDPSAGNPVEPTEASIARGRVLFEQNCVVCHGVDGRGDGPQAADLNPAPSDFRLHVPFHTDVELYRFIADGYPGTAMPAWRDDFSEEDIWNLVNFLRANFSEAPTQ